MLERIVAYFARRHLLANLIFISVIIGGIFAWRSTGKEELPDITFDRVRISAGYPGAPSEDVEYFVTRPIEEELRGVDHIRRVTSTSSVGQANISVQLEDDIADIDSVVTEIRDAVMSVDLPAEILDDPNVRVFKTSRKAIVDIAIYHTKAPILTVEARRALQQIAFALENQLTSLPEVNSINKSGYLRQEIQIRAYPEKLRRFNIPFNTVISDIEANHLRRPAGTLNAKMEPKVTLLSELNTTEKLDDFIVQGGFEGQVVRLGEVADITAEFEKNEAVYKVNGHEAVMFSVVKNSSAGILDALRAVQKTVERFKNNNLEGGDIEVVFLDDESIDVRNRLALIGLNGSLGFILILLTLFVFLNMRAGFWVAMGIPFTLCFTMIGASLIGYTINGTTLAAVIIVLGMVVDDAIVVAENITRKIQEGMARTRAAVEGTVFVFKPVLASIVTTCAAFLPLYFFTGHFSKIIEFIPAIIFFMLGASLFESLLILPGHMSLPDFGLRRRAPGAAGAETRGHWFDRVEDAYARLLEGILPHKWLLLAGFAVLALLIGGIASQKMKFVMFPNEETRDIVLTGYAPAGFTRYETAGKVGELEDVIAPHLGKEVVGYRTQIARSRRGGAVEENKFTTIIEIVPKERRKRSADQIIEDWKGKTDQREGFTKLEFRKSRWGQESGSPLEILVQLNDDHRRSELTRKLMKALGEYPVTAHPEIDEGQMVPEYRISLNREKIKRLAINPADLAKTFRAALEGAVLYEFSDGDEEIFVRLTTVDSAKDDIEHVLSIPVENKSNYLVPLRDVVHVEKVTVPNAIARFDMRRTTLVYADMAGGTKVTPLEAAEYLENNVFPGLLKEYPSAALSFEGEVKDTRESKRDLAHAVILVLIFVFVILAVLFDSLLKPLVIMLAIPFGVVGIFLAFMLHGKEFFGFYAGIGALGLAGVVINDSIIMMVKLGAEDALKGSRAEYYRQVAGIAKTRLRAVLLTTLTTVAGVLPTAYGFAGYDDMLGEMMLALAWGLMFGTVVTLILIPCVYSVGRDLAPIGETLTGRLVHHDEAT